MDVLDSDLPTIVQVRLHQIINEKNVSLLCACNNTSKSTLSERNICVEIGMHIKQMELTKHMNHNLLRW